MVVENYCGQKLGLDAADVGKDTGQVFAYSLDVLACMGDQNFGAQLLAVERQEFLNRSLQNSRGFFAALLVGVSGSRLHAFAGGLISKGENLGSCAAAQLMAVLPDPFSHGFRGGPDFSER